MKRKNHKLFALQAKDAQPKIEAFIPKPVYTDESEVDIKCLEEAVNSLNVSDAMLIYRLLTAKNITISDDLKQNLLELVCFYNHTDPLPFEMFEARSAKEATKRSRNAQTELWEENCLADQLFQSIELKTPAAYNTMIRALYKYNSLERAEEVFNEAKQNGIAIDLETYNVFIRNFNRPGVTADMRWEQIKTTLKELNEKQIKPNIHTLNAILATLKTGGNINTIQDYAIQTLAEFERLNIEPALETYAHLLDIFHAKFAPPSNIIDQIVERMEKSPDLKAQCIDDTLFFYKAMVVCRFRLKNGSAIARRIDNIVTHSDNVKFLGDAQQEQMYHRCLLSCILHNEPLAEFIRAYDQLVPETYCLEPKIVDDIFSTINLNGAIQYLPKFWSDMVISGISKNSKINEILLSLMIENQPVDDIREHNGLADQFGEIAWTIYQDEMNEQFVKVQREKTVHASRLAQIIILLLRANQHGEARSIVLSCLDQQKDKRIVGCLTDQALTAFIDSCISNKEPRIAIDCVAYSVENGIGDAIQYGRRIVQSFTLEPNQIKRITDLVGQDVMKSV